MIFEKMVILMGVDGSGKTTHARVLQSEFRNSGIRCKYIWFRSAYFFSLPFMAICRGLGFVKLHRLPNGHTYPEHLYSKRPLSLLWPWVQFFDTALFSLAKIKSSMIFDDLIIADRFVYDIMIDVMIAVGDPFFFESFVGKLIRRLIPPKTVFVVFDLDEQTALQRKNDIPNRDYLKIRRRFYLSLAGSDMTVIDSSGSFQATHEHLMRNLQIQRGRLASAYIEKQLQGRLMARAHWKKWKKGPIVFLRRSLSPVIAQLSKTFATKALPKANTGNPHSSNVAGNYLQNYVDLLRKRGLLLHAVVLVGSRAKNRWTSRSDADIIVVASGLPKGVMRRFAKYSILSDAPLFLGVEPYGCTKEEFLHKVKNLDLLVLDAFYSGRVLFDDGFWDQVAKDFEKIEGEYYLNKDKLKLSLSLI